MNDEKLIQKEKRILQEAKFIIDGKHTIRTTAKHFNVSKSAVHLDVTKDLKSINYKLYLEVQKVIEFNKRQRKFRAGLGMKKRKERLLTMKQHLFLNKKGISNSVESAGMLIVVAMMLALIMQVSLWSVTQISVKGAAYEAARGGAKVGVNQANSRATTIANQYGQGVLAKWKPQVQISNNGKFITIIVTHDVPGISKLFPSVKVSSSSKEVIEEIA